MSAQSLHGSDVVRNVSEMAELRQGSLVTATQMRKYLATTLQLLDMKESELRWVTDHLGHTVDVHKKWYRLSNKAVELTKIASILAAAESGHLRNAHNVQFDDVSKETPSANESSAPEPPNTNNATKATSAAKYIIKDMMPAEEVTTEKVKGGFCTAEDSSLSAPTDDLLLKDSYSNICAPKRGDSKNPKKPNYTHAYRNEKKVIKKQVRTPWTVEGKKALYSAFGAFLERSTAQLPGKAAITKAQSDFLVLQKRTRLNVKFQLKNLKEKKR